MKKTIALITALALCPLAPAMSATKLTPQDCTALGAITQHAADLRKGGASRKRAMRKMKSTHTDKRYKDTLPFLVDFVYGLPKSQLSDDVGDAYRKACNGA